MSGNRILPGAEQRAQQIKLILFDVDGVLTDGTIWFFPAGGSSSRSSSLHTPRGSRSSVPANLPPGTAIPAGSGMVEVKGFNAHDGIGFTLARRAGLKTGVITKRISQSLALRAQDLHMDYIRQGVERKFDMMRTILSEAGLTRDQVCCMGDDIIDLPMLRNCGLAAAPADARPEVIESAHFIAAHPGGAGAARDLIEFILRQQAKWQPAAAQYIAEAEGQ